jgi:DNA primase
MTPNRTQDAGGRRQSEIFLAGAMCDTHSVSAYIIPPIFLTGKWIPVECRKKRRVLLADTFVEFKIIKAQVSIETVLAYYHINLRRVNQHSLRGKCPLPTHSSEQSSESFIVEKVKNVWACQSSSCVASREGRKGGNVLDFVAVMERCSIRDAALKLQSWFLGASPTTKNTEEKKSATTSQTISEKGDGVESGGVNKPLSFTLKDIDHVHSYLRSRGLKTETTKVFGAGCFPGRGSMSGRVVIPIHNESGELIAYAGRAIDDSEPKYKLPAGFRKSDVLFNVHRALLHDPNKKLIVVEGFFDCMKVHQAGFTNVVALMGSSLSEPQEKVLAKFARLILFFDGDEAGREAGKTIASRLVHRTFVRIISCPDKKQPDQLSSEELGRILV